jgi:two-component system cell cycle response regulator DivK
MREGLDSRDELPLVLLIDDAPGFGEGIKSFLATAGFRVALARNGFEGMQKVVELSPDVILMDLDLPGMDGAETTRHLKHQGATKEIPIIAFTGLTVIPDLDRLRQKGFEELLSKSCELEELADKIRAVLRKRSAPSAAQEGQ